MPTNQKKNEDTVKSSSDNVERQDSGSGEDQVQEAFDEAAEKGYFGTVPDPTPNENYSLQTPPDAPTPETDAGMREKARLSVASLSDADRK